jgi:hypothetical protein
MKFVLYLILLSQILNKQHKTIMITEFYTQEVD